VTSMFGAIEAGGTKFVCGVGTGQDDFEEVRFATTTPEQTLERVSDYFRSYRGRLDGIGVGTFGPVDLDAASLTWGYITSTPKAHWSNTDVIGHLRKEFDVPYAFDTDVNAAALGEAKWGAAVGLDNVVYITIGTGVGGGVLSGGRLVHGLVHPELGHMFLQKHPQDTFTGHCPFHQDRCLEGLCAGPAIEARWGKPGYELESDHLAWEFQAFYVAQALVNIVCTLSPQIIILGGGVMDQTRLLSAVRDNTVNFLNAYVQHPLLTEKAIERFIVRPGLGNKSGLMGALAMVQDRVGEA